MGVDENTYDLVISAHNDVTKYFEAIEHLAEYHQVRLLDAMNKCQISGRHFAPTSGYGYGDEGRDMLDRLFASVFGGQDAIVRVQWASATHALNDCMFAMLRPGEAMLSITGKPYDTLDKTIGSDNNSACGSLKDWGIGYYQTDLTLDGNIDLTKVAAFLDVEKIKLILIQRSGGYSRRPSITIEKMKDAIHFIRLKRPDICVLVDNCYGEFTETTEPCHAGADLAVGSLIKNPGGGLAPTGAYAVGTKQAIERLSYTFTTPGLGKDIGSYAASYTPFYQGLFLAPHVVSQAIKGAILTAKVFGSLGFKVFPIPQDKRSDIIQSIEFNSADELIAFCQAIQAASPVDSHVVPYPWDMPGYSHKVIMAAGTFMQGASIELSADAPIKDPYIAFMQGGLTYAHVKIALIRVIQSLKRQGFINI